MNLFYPELLIAVIIVFLVTVFPICLIFFVNQDDSDSNHS